MGVSAELHGQPPPFWALGRYYELAYDFSPANGFFPDDLPLDWPTIGMCAAYAS
jgi:hypothetical protein